MGVFCFNFKQDLLELLDECGIAKVDYQRLEFVFRQVMRQSWATSYHYSQSEEVVELSQCTPAIVDKALQNWRGRYPNADYGFERLEVRERTDRKASKIAYRKSLSAFTEIFAGLKLAGKRELQDTWITDLTASLANNRERAQVNVSCNLAQLSTLDRFYFVDYIAIAISVFLPHFVMQMQNRYGTSEKFFEFLVLKLSIESDRVFDIAAFGDIASEVQNLSQEAARAGLASLAQALPAKFPIAG